MTDASQEVLRKAIRKAKGDEAEAVKERERAIERLLDAEKDLRAERNQRARLEEEFIALFGRGEPDGTTSAKDAAAGAVTSGDMADCSVTTGSEMPMPSDISRYSVRARADGTRLVCLDGRPLCEVTTMQDLMNMGILHDIR